MESKYIPGYMVNHLRDGLPPPHYLIELAEYWGSSDESDRRILQGFANAPLVRTGQVPLSEVVPETYFPDLYAESLDAFRDLCLVGAFGIEAVEESADYEYLIVR